MVENRLANILEKNAQGIDHIAIAVENLEIAISWYSSVAGFTLLERMETKGAKTGMISAVMKAGPVVFVLVQGTEKESQVSKFVDKFGPGVQHVAIRVKNLDEVQASLEEAGMGFEAEIIEGRGIRQVFSAREEGCATRLEFIERRGGNFTPETVEKLFRAMEKNGSY